MPIFKSGKASKASYPAKSFGNFSRSSAKANSRGARGMRRGKVARPLMQMKRQGYSNI